MSPCRAQPPIPASEFNVSAKLPDLTVEGDVMLKQFDFLVDNKIDKPVKIGRVGDSHEQAASAWCD